MFKEDSEIISTIASVAFILIAAGVVLFILFSAYRNRSLLHQRQIIDLESKYQQELLHTQIEIQEKTLKEISQEIHDNLGQTLTVAKLNLTTLDFKKENAAQKVASSAELLTKAIQDLRTLSKILNTDIILASGLLKAAELELQLLNKASDFKGELQVSGYPVRIDARKELILFRVVQEALSNVIKHSGGDIVIIHFDFKESALHFSIEDNGKGFDVDKISDGSGLKNMRNRVELIGGDFDMESSSSLGTKIKINIPIKEYENNNGLG